MRYELWITDRYANKNRLGEIDCATIHEANERARQAALEFPAGQYTITVDYVIRITQRPPSAGYSNIIEKMIDDSNQDLLQP